MRFHRSGYTGTVWHCVTLYLAVFGCIGTDYTVLHCIWLYWHWLHCIALYLAVYGCTGTDYTVLHCIWLYWHWLHCITLYYTVLHCITLYPGPVPHTPYQYPVPLTQVPHPIPHHPRYTGHHAVHYTRQCIPVHQASFWLLAPCMCLTRFATNSIEYKTGGCLGGYTTVSKLSVYKGLQRVYSIISLLTVVTSA